jgi:hypothetical protein
MLLLINWSYKSNFFFYIAYLNRSESFCCEEKADLLKGAKNGELGDNSSFY